ncbi:MAG TPA: hypothetical protein VNY84_03655, partial [Acidimicrobiales bacterium]|nr:hypothetical protein [Acidimicrobiales bacterium]
TAPLRPPNTASIQARLGAEAGLRPIRDVATGPATVASYTVAHGRDGAPVWGLAICDLPGDVRTYARLEDADLMATVEATEWIGATVELVPGADNVNLVKV